MSRRRFLWTRGMCRKAGPTTTSAEAQQTLKVEEKMRCEFAVSCCTLTHRLWPGLEGLPCLTDPQSLTHYWLCHSAQKARSCDNRTCEYNFVIRFVLTTHAFPVATCGIQEHRLKSLQRVSIACKADLPTKNVLDMLRTLCAAFLTAMLQEKRRSMCQRA